MTWYNLELFAVFVAIMIVGITIFRLTVRPSAGMAAPGIMAR